MQNKARSRRGSQLKLHARWQKASRRDATQQEELGDAEAVHTSEAEKKRRELARVAREKWPSETWSEEDDKEEEIQFQTPLYKKRGKNMEQF